MNSDTLVKKAIQFTLEVHAGRIRKDASTLYVVHPIAVGLILAQYGFPESVVAAGFCHDALRDGSMPGAANRPVTQDDLEQHLGAEVATIVAETSRNHSERPWREQKEKEIEALRTARWQVRAVVAAAKLDCLRTMSVGFTELGSGVWARYSHGREELSWYYFEVFQALISNLTSAPAALHTLLGALDDITQEFFRRVYCNRYITLDRRACERVRDSGADYYIAVDPDTCSAQIVTRPKDSSGLLLQGHEDIFPLCMAFEGCAAFLPGGDWTAIPVQGHRQHDGDYRSYHIRWI